VRRSNEDDAFEAAGLQSGDTGKPARLIDIFG
jgi:hypothetical protein